MSETNLKIAIGAIVKNEADYLLEWIAYHWVVGVSHFLIASNDSTDESNVMLLKLQKLGLVTFVDFPTSGAVKPQLPAYQKLLSVCPDDIDLVAFIDADEYLTSSDNESSILPFLQQFFSDDGVSALAMHWACFGSAGQLFKDEGMVIERFTRQSLKQFTANKNYKTIVRPKMVKQFRTPHYTQLIRGAYLNTLGKDVASVADRIGVSVEPVWEHLRVNHYVVKSLEEFVVGKSRKGSAATKGRIKHKQYFQSHDRNDEDWTYSNELIADVKNVLYCLESLLLILDETVPQKTWFNRSKLTKSQLRDKTYLEKSRKFDSVWYLMKYPDVANSGMEPIEHFVRFGAEEKRNPIEFFDINFYMHRYKDVAKSRMNPYVHYLKYGAEEGRVAHPLKLS